MENKTLQIPTQKDLVAIIESNAAACQTVKASLITIADVTAEIAKNKNIQNFSSNVKSFTKIGSFVTKYSELTATIIKSLSAGVPAAENKSLLNLAEIMGRVETEDAKDKTKKIVKYTTVEAFQQINTIISEMVTMLEKLATADFGFGATRRLKKNIKLMGMAMVMVMDELLYTLQDIATMPGMQDIIKTLVKQPDKTFETIKNDVSNNNGNILDKTITEKTIEQGQLGILDVITQTFSIINTLNSLQAPSFIKLKIELIKMKIALKMVVGMLLKFSKEMATPETLKSIESLSVLIGGDENKKDGVNQGLLKISQKVVFLFETLSEWKFNNRQHKVVQTALNNLQDIINRVILLVSDNSFKELEKNNLGKSIQKGNENLCTVHDMFITMGNMVLDALKINIFKKLIINAIDKAIEIIVKVNTLAKDENKISDNLQDTLEVVQQVLDSTKYIFSTIKEMLMPGLLISILGKHLLKGINIILQLIAKVKLFSTDNYYKVDSELQDTLETVSIVFDTLNTIFKTISQLIKPGLAISIFDKKLLKSVNTVLLLVARIKVFNKDDFYKVDDTLEETLCLVHDIFEITGMIFNTVSSFIKQAIKVKIFGKQLVNGVGKIIELVKKLKELNEDDNKIDESLVKTLKTLESGLELVKKIFKHLSAMIAPAILIRLFGWAITGSIKTIAKIITKLKDIDGKDVEKASDIIKKIEQITNDLKKIAVRLILLAILAIPALIAALAVVLFVAGLMLVVWVMNLLFKLINKCIKNVKDGVKDILWMLTLILVVGAVLLIIAFFAPVIFDALLETVVVVLAILVFTLVLALVFWVLQKITHKAAKEMLNIALNILIIVGLFVVVGLLLLFAGEIGAYIMEGDSILNIIVAIGSIIVLIGIIVVLGKCLEKYAKNLISMQATILPVLAVIGLLITAGISLLIFGWIGKQMTEGDTEINIAVAVGVATAFVLAAALFGKLLQKMLSKVVVTIASITPVIIVAGLLLAAGLELLLFGKIGEQMTEGNTLLNIGIAIAVVSGFVALSAALGFALKFALIPLGAAVLGMGAVMLVALEMKKVSELLLELGVYGQQMTEGGTLSNVLTAIGVISAYAALVAVMGIGLAFALAPIAIAIAGLLVVSLAIETMFPVSRKLLELGQIGIQMTADNTLGMVSHIILVIGAVGAELVVLGAAMIPIAIGCGILSIFIWPYLASLELVARAAQSIYEMSQLEIEDQKAKDVMNSIKKFYSSYKDFVQSFSLKDMIIISMTKGTVNTVMSTVHSIHRVANELNTIQEINLNDATLTGKVRDMLKLTKSLQSLVNELLAGNTGGNWITRWLNRRAAEDSAKKAKEKLNKVEQVVESLKTVADSLREVQEITLRESDIANNIDYIFGFIGTLEEHIKASLEKATVFDDNIVSWKYVKDGWFRGHWEPVYEENATVKRLNKVDQVVSTLQNVATTIQDLQNLHINSSKILNNVTFIFQFIETLSKHVEECLKNTKVLEDHVEKVWVRHTSYGKLFGSKTPGHWETRVTENKAVKHLNKVDQVVSSIYQITNTLQDLVNLNLDSETQTRVLDNVDAMFKFVEKVADKVNKLYNPDKKVKDIETGLMIDNTDAIKRAQFLISDQFAKAAEKMGTLGTAIKALSDYCSSINTIKDFRIDEIDNRVIDKNITELFTTGANITDKVNEYLQNSEAVDAAEVSYFTNGIQELSNAFENLGNKDLGKFKQNTEVFAKFLGNVHSTDMAKVEKTATLFKHMTEFSNTINGNFEKLAETLSEKLLPVLEDLKEVMVEVPGKMEEGFSNASKSIGALSSTPSKANYEAQVKRENPSWSEDKVTKEAETRLKDKSKADANGIAAKLDELISMFKGYGTPAKVKLS